MFNLFDIYKQLLLVNYKNLSYDVKRNIFEYLIDDYKEIINIYYIKKSLKKYLEKSILDINITPIFHISDFPYPISKENLKYKIDNIFNENNKNYYFSHYCCNGRGLMYDHPNFDRKKLLKLNYN